MAIGLFRAEGGNGYVGGAFTLRFLSLSHFPAVLGGTCHYLFHKNPTSQRAGALKEGTQLGSQENGLHAILTQGTALPTLRGLRRDASTSHTPHFAGELRETGRTSRSSEEGAQSEGTLGTTGTQAWGTGVETAAELSTSPSTGSWLEDLCAPRAASSCTFANCGLDVTGHRREAVYKCEKSFLFPILNKHPPNTRQVPKSREEHF